MPTFFFFKILLMPPCCVICQDDLGDDPRCVGTLSCGHKFHNACIIQALEYDHRCPLCRNDPRVAHEAAPANPNLPQQTFVRALSEASANWDSDARVRRSFNTAMRWADEITRLRRTLRILERELRPEREHMVASIREITAKKRHAFARTHRHKLEEIARLSQELTRAKRLRNACHARVAARYGYVSP